LKYDPETRALQFSNDEEVVRFHSELTALMRTAVTAVSRHGEDQEGKAAAQGVFKELPSIMRALNAFRKHLAPTADGA
jgi:hypothetical protein